MNIVSIIPARGGSKGIPKKIYLAFVENHLFKPHKTPDSCLEM
jgi:CMP-N-acetylneuraminic acid synthetase